MISHIVILLIHLIPASRLYWLKAVLLGMIPRVEVARNARIQMISISGVGVSIGCDVFIGRETLFIGGSKSTVSIGDYCDISSRVSFVTGTHQISPKEKRIAGVGTSNDINIGKGSWIGAGAQIMGGVDIGQKCIVAAGALVINNVESYSIVAGVPAKVIKVYDPDMGEWVKSEGD